MSTSRITIKVPEPRKADASPFDPHPLVGQPLDLELGSDRAIATITAVERWPDCLIIELEVPTDSLQTTLLAASMCAGNYQ